MEADISIWRKTGHFYFALTRTYSANLLSVGSEPNVRAWRMTTNQGCGPLRLGWETELSGTESKGSRGRPGTSGPFRFFSFLKGPAPLRQGFLRIALWTASLGRVWLSRPGHRSRGP